ncbi:hypothetical protein U1Q18_051156 [Sarracenia purpurea var. burkii]
MSDTNSNRVQRTASKKANDRIRDIYTNPRKLKMDSGNKASTKEAKNKKNPKTEPEVDVPSGKPGIDSKPTPVKPFPEMGKENNNDSDTLDSESGTGSESESESMSDEKEQPTSELPSQATDQKGNQVPDQPQLSIFDEIMGNLCGSDNMQTYKQDPPLPKHTVEPRKPTAITSLKLSEEWRKKVEERWSSIRQGMDDSEPKDDFWRIQKLMKMAP